MDNNHPPRRFLLIEPSLKQLGGHFFEYAWEILHAAESAGFEPVLATHRRFADQASLPDRWPVYPLFPFSSDRIHRVAHAHSYELNFPAMRTLAGLRAGCWRTLDGLSDRGKSALSRFRWYRHRRRIRGFAAACHALTEAVQLRAGDLAFCSTMSDLDLLGLVDYLRRSPESVAAEWHLQFHFNIFAGREPDFPAQQRRADRLGRRFQRALASVPKHRLHFYTTTEDLARQFRRLGVAPFCCLPWPISRRFRRRQPPRERVGPLRLVCAGGVRREKGGDQLAPLIDRLWDEFLAAGQLQLVFQADTKRRLRARFELLTEKLAELEPRSSATAPLVSVPHPLDGDAYAQLIQTADIGLLLYHSAQYYARCSGILVEFLAAGVPVIVPAGCWLATPVEAANREHLQYIFDREHPLRVWRGDDVKWQAPCQADARPPLAAQVRAWSTPNVCSLQLGPSATPRDLLVRFRWLAPDSPGVHVRIEARQFDLSGRRLTTSIHTLGPQIDGPAAAAAQGNAPTRSVADLPCLALFHVQPQTVRIDLCWQNAYHRSAIEVGDVSAALLAAASTRDGHRPSGKFGLVAADWEQVPQLLREMTQHYDAYRHASAAFARRWLELHASARTIELLVAAGAARSSGNTVRRVDQRRTAHRRAPLRKGTSKREKQSVIGRTETRDC